MNIPLVVLVVIGIWFFLILKIQTTTLKDKLKRIDILGIIIFVGSATSFLFGLTAGGVLFEWNSPHVIVPLVIGVLGMLAFWFVEVYVAKEPLMPMRVFKEYTAFAGYLGTWTLGIILWSLIYYLVLWVESPFHPLTVVPISSHSLHAPSRCRYTCHHLHHCSLGNDRRYIRDNHAPIPHHHLARVGFYYHRLRPLHTIIS